MREILFRAKRIDNGEWTIGSLIQTPYLGNMRSWISSEQDDKTRLRSISTYQAEWRAFEVRTDTVCQFTGLTDKNGNKIWENDVLKCGDAIAKVSWCDIFASYRLDTNQWMYTLFFGDDCKSEDVEVIGNVFDNPELLN